MSVQNARSKPTLLGLTGGIGSGKTTAADYFKSLNIPVIDCDQIVKNLWKTNLEMVNQAESFFGFTIKEDKDRKKLSNIIFNDEEKRKELNHIVHPYVFKEIERQKDGFFNKKLIVIDMPLLIEVEYQKNVDHIVLVYVDRDTQIKRLMDRDHIAKEVAIKRIESQLSLDEKKKYADYILMNEESKQNLYNQINALLEVISNEK